MSRLEFFKANPEIRHEVLEFLITKHFLFNEYIFKDLPQHEVQKNFYDELQNPELDSKGKNLIAAYLYMQCVMRNA